jgi:hypothetical protein
LRGLLLARPHLQYLVITEKSYPKGRIKIILVNADLGF